MPQRHHALSGKWMLFVKAEQADALWPEVVELLLLDKLGPTAKVPPFRAPG
jgi:hypothetical protein